MVSDDQDPLFDADFLDEVPVPSAPGAKVKSAHVWERDELDWYVEPVAATEALLRVERFVGPVWDPCCGGGNIPTALGAAGCQVVGTDIVRRFPSEITPAWWWGTFDFRDARASLDGQPPSLPFPEWHATNIVMNPPFFRAKGAEEFIRKALEVARGKVAAFVDIRFIAGGERANGLFAEHPPHRIWIVTPRVSCPPGAYLVAGNKAGGGSADWCWLVWDKSAPPVACPQLDWLRRRAA